MAGADNVDVPNPLGEHAADFDDVRMASDFDDMQEDFDVFGFGGSLDQPPQQDDNGGSSRGPCQTNGASSNVGQARSAARGTTSIWKSVTNGGVTAAIGRLMQGSRPPRADSADRMRALKKRIIDKAAARGGGAVAAIDVTGDQRSRSGQGDDGQWHARTACVGAEASGGAHGGSAGSGEEGALTQDGYTGRDGDRGSSDVVVAGAVYGVKRAMEPSTARMTKRRVDHRREEGGGADSVDTKDATASDAITSVGAACAGPGDPHQRRLTEPVTSRYRSADVAGSVAVGAGAATLPSDDYARLVADTGRGKAAHGPPCDPAVSQDGITGAGDSATKCASSSTLQEKHRGKGGGGTPRRRSTNTPLEPPARLGVGPSTGRALREDDGGRPTRKEYARRRDGSAEPEAQPSAARDRGGAAAAGLGEGPPRGPCHRTRGARKPECLSIRRDAGILLNPPQSGGTEHRGTGDGSDRDAQSDVMTRRPGHASGKNACQDEQMLEGYRGRERLGGDEASRMYNAEDTRSCMPSSRHVIDGGEESSGAPSAASGQGASADGTPTSSQARLRLHRGPPSPTGPRGGGFNDPDSDVDDVRLESSSRFEHVHPPLTSPSSAPAARPHLRPERPLAPRAHRGDPEDRLQEPLRCSTATGGGAARRGEAARRTVGGAGIWLDGGASSSVAAVTIGHSSSGGGSGPAEDARPKRRRLNGKQPVDTCSADRGKRPIGVRQGWLPTCADRVQQDGDEQSGNERWCTDGDYRKDQLEAQQSARGTETRIWRQQAATRADAMDATTDAARAASGGRASGLHGAHSGMGCDGVGLDLNSDFCSASGGPSRFPVDTSTRQCSLASPNRDGPELSARCGSGGSGKRCWRKRPPDRSGGAA